MIMVFLQSGLIYIPLCVYTSDRNCMCVSFCCMVVPSRCPCESESRGGRPPSLESCVPSTVLHLEAQGFCPVKISSPPAVTPTRADFYVFTGCSEASEEDEERLTFTLQQYLSFSCSSRPSSSCSSLLSSFMSGCSDTLAMILSLRR